MRSDIEFPSEGRTLRGWLYRPDATRQRHPCIVMAHGLSAVKEQYLDRYAEVFRAAGFGVVLYDHVNFGASDGQPRQEADPVLQRRGYRDAISFAETVPWVDARYVAFGLANPAAFAIMNEVGTLASESPAMLAGLVILRERVEQIARAARLRMPVERAVALIHAAGVGTVTTLLAIPEEERDPQLSSVIRDSVIASIIINAPDQGQAGLASLAVGLRAHLGSAEVLTPGECLLLSELLDRLARPSEG